MAASREDISRWFDTAKKQGATHLVVACDTFEWEDYPIYVMPGQNVHEIVAPLKRRENMQSLMEVYNLNLDKAVQMNEHRSYNY